MPRHHGYESSSMISSDLESTSFFDSDDDASSRITATTTGNKAARRTKCNVMTGYIKGACSVKRNGNDELFIAFKYP